MLLTALLQICSTSAPQRQVIVRRRSWRKGPGPPMLSGHVPSTVASSPSAI